MDCNVDCDNVSGQESYDVDESDKNCPDACEKVDYQLDMSLAFFSAIGVGQVSSDTYKLQSRSV